MLKGETPMRAFLQSESTEERHSSARPDPIIGKQVYITQSNFYSIVWSFKDRIPAQKLPRNFFPLHWIQLQTQRDWQFMSTAYWALQDTGSFIEWCYRKVREQEEAPNLLFKNRAPAYHLSLGCDRLHADYANVTIPPQIQSRGEKEIQCFKEWANEAGNRRLFEDNIELFKVKICTRFNISPNQLHLIIRENSGSFAIGNENLDEIARLIEKLIREAHTFETMNPQNRAILAQYKKYSGLGSSRNPLTGNRTGYPEKIVKSVLRTFYGQFKKPLNRLLLTWIRVKCNSELVFQGSLLEQLGFKACKHCHQKATHSTSEKGFPCLDLF
jgi:hypothetical protein